MKATVGLLTLMLLLGVADAALVEGMPQTPSAMPVLTNTEPEVPTPIVTTPSPSGGVRRHTGPDVMTVVRKEGFETTAAREKVILQKIVPSDGSTLHSYVLLKDGDRAGLIAWTSSSKVKEYYLVLKEALHSAFTADVQDLLDETQRREGRPTRNLLTFFDPGIVSERVVFVRVREQLYEFHVTEGSSGIIFDLIEELTK